MIRAEMKVTFFTTKNHTLENLIKENRFTIVSKENWIIQQESTGLMFSYIHYQIHEPRDEGYGISFHYCD